MSFAIVQIKVKHHKYTYFSPNRFRQPLFPDFLTILSSLGQWFGPAGRANPNKLLTLTALIFTHFVMGRGGGGGGCGAGPRPPPRETPVGIATTNKNTPPPTPPHYKVHRYSAPSNSITCSGMPRGRARPRALRAQYRQEAEETSFRNSALAAARSRRKFSLSCRRDTTMEAQTRPAWTSLSKWKPRMTRLSPIS